MMMTIVINHDTCYVSVNAMNVKMRKFLLDLLFSWIILKSKSNHRWVYVQANTSFLATCLQSWVFPVLWWIRPPLSSIMTSDSQGRVSGVLELYSLGPAWTRLRLVSDVCTVQTCPSSTDWRSRVVVCRYSMLVSPHTLLRTLILSSDEYEEIYSVKYIVHHHHHHHHHHHQCSVWVDSECESEI